MKLTADHVVGITAILAVAVVIIAAIVLGFNNSNTINADNAKVKVACVNNGNQWVSGNCIHIKG